MIASILAIATNSVSCSGGQDPDTVARRNALLSIMERQANQYQNCKTDSDCTYLPDVGGLILSKEGLVYVQTCAKRLKKVLFPACFSEGPVMLSTQQEFGMELDQTNFPKNVECKQSKCVASQISSGNRNWVTENSDYRSNHARHPKIDQQCENEIRSLNLPKVDETCKCRNQEAFKVA